MTKIECFKFVMMFVFIVRSAAEVGVGVEVAAVQATAHRPSSVHRHHCKHTQCYRLYNGKCTSGADGNAFWLKRSYSTPGPVSTAMGDCLRAGKPSRSVS